MKNEIRDTVVEGVRNILDGSGTLIETVIAISLINDLDRLGLLSLSDSLFGLLLDLSRDAESVKLKVMANAKRYPDIDPLEVRLSASTRRRANEAWSYELKETRPLRDRARRIFDRATGRPS